MVPSIPHPLFLRAVRAVKNTHNACHPPSQRRHIHTSTMRVGAVASRLIASLKYANFGPLGVCLWGACV